MTEHQDPNLFFQVRHKHDSRTSYFEPDGRAKSAEDVPVKAEAEYNCCYVPS